MDRAGVDAWVARYVEAWASNDAGAVGALVSDDAEYLTGPLDEPWRGREAIVAGWLDHRDEPGTWRVEHVSTHVTGDTAFVESRISYPAEGVRYANLSVLSLDGAGRATRFVEWWMKAR